MFGRRVKIKISRSDVFYDILKWLIMGAFALVCLLPMLHLLGVSLAPYRELARNPYLLWPSEITFESYRMVLSAGAIPRSLANSVIITVLGVATSMLLTSVFAYGLSKREVPGNRTFNFIVLVFIVFQVGIIPLYIAMRTYRLVGTYWSIVFASAINPFWCIIMRNFFEELPSELFDCAKIEGASEVRTFWSVALPLSKASIAAISLFYSVFFWNDYFFPLMFVSRLERWPITVWMYQMVSAFQQENLVQDAATAVEVQEDNIKATVIFISITPIVILYPFLQKYFAQGVTLGAVKG